jgi:hypothetical protein
MKRHLLYNHIIKMVLLISYQKLKYSDTEQVFGLSYLFYGSQIKGHDYYSLEYSLYNIVCESEIEVSVRVCSISQMNL